MTGAVARLRAWLAEPNPILVKELRATFRTNLFVRFLYLTTGLVGLIVMVTGTAAAADDAPPATVGQIVFHLFFGAILLVLCLVAPGYASAAITGEREQETWESLQLSGMSPWRIVMGKFFACYASIALVMIAFSPVVGVAFLFGGVSPWQVLFGFLSMLIALAPPIAFGVAMSARLPSTRLSIVLTTFVYFPIALAGVFILGAAGEEAKRAWGLGTEGPFFYTEALANHLDRPDVWGLLVLLPLYAFGMPTWFLLASAVAGVRSPAEDRSTAMKAWALAMLLTSLVAAGVLVTTGSGARQAGEIAILVQMAMAIITIFIAITFANEPPLPPRPMLAKRASWPAGKRMLLALGPGAASTLRFAWVVNAAAPLLCALVVGGVHSLLYPGWNAERQLALSLALAGLALGTIYVAGFVASSAMWLRLVLRSGVAARVLVLALVAAAIVFPFLLALVADPQSVDRLDRYSPFVIQFSPIQPGLLAVQLYERRGGWPLLAGLAIPCLLYGLSALLFTVLVELRVRAAYRLVESRRAALEARVAERLAPGPEIDRKIEPDKIEPDKIEPDKIDKTEAEAP